MVKKMSITNRLTKKEALDLIKTASLVELGEMATKRKSELHPEKITSFVVDRNINYTNVCWVDCKFCAFYRHGRDDDSYVLSYEEIDKKIAQLKLDAMDINIDQLSDEQQRYLTSWQEGTS